MKIFLLLFSLLTLSVARENPFTPMYDTPKACDSDIAILNIASNKTFDTTQKKNVHINISSQVPKLPTVTVPSKPIVKSSPINIKTVKVKIEPNSKKSKNVTTTVKKKREKSRQKEVVSSYKTIYKNYFLKIASDGKHLKIYCKDSLTKQSLYINPSRVVLDFTKLQYFHSKRIILKQPLAKIFKVGSHHDFYRITLEQGKLKKYKVHKTHYGYLLSFY